MIRYRGPKKKALERVKELDVFDKVEETYVETSPIGGTLSIITFLLVVWLIYSEVTYYIDSNLVFKFSPDTDLDAKLKINIDMTVAMPCSMIGADILDSTSQNVYAFGELHEEDTWFELGEEQRMYFDSMRYINTYLREEYHAISKFLWRSRETAIQGAMPARGDKLDRPHDACRVHGSLTLNKVSGNFHITAGKSLHLAGSHIHLSMLFGKESSNFSHRINRFSFGDPASGIIHPLEGYEMITDDPTLLYQYFVEVVATEVDTTLSQIKTYQYSVKEHARPINHAKGSHGMPGVFFKYDVSALKLKVSQERDNIIQFTIRLFSIIGGIYIIAGAVNSILQIIKLNFMKRFAPQLYELPSKQKNGFPPTEAKEKLINTLLANSTSPYVPVDLLRMKS